MRRLTIAALLGVAVAGAAATGYLLSLGAALDRLGSEVEAELSDVVAGVDAQLEPFRKLPRVLADNDTLVNALADPSPEILHRSDLLLDRLAAATGAQDIYLLDRTGLTIAASNWDAPRTFIGRSFDYRPYFTMAMEGALGRYFALGTTSHERGFYFASALTGPDGRSGVITVKVGVDEIESRWRGDREAVFFTDPDGIVFLASRPGLLFGALEPLSEARLRDIAASRQYSDAELHTLPERRSVDRAGRNVVAMDAPGWSRLGIELPEAIHRSETVHRIGMTAHILRDTAPAYATARQTALLAGAVTLAAALGILLDASRRARLSERLRIKAAANVWLETRVEERTRDLTREVAERRAAEEALRRVQDDLVQASKLSALGQMSAGISHELNQPLTAIRSFAENGRVLMERGRYDEAAGNLSQIADLTGRMARIIRNLRAFARKEGEPATDVALDRVVQDALDLMERRIAEEGVEIDWSPRPEIVRGGAVRLTQVVVNLLGNALDAMAGQEERRVEIAILPGTETTRLTLRDTGPGLASDGKTQIFDPFYTTKTVGSGEGLGLGLSISYGIVQSFGGAIRGENHPDGGALFTIDLPRAALKAAE